MIKRLSSLSGLDGDITFFIMEGGLHLFFWSVIVALVVAAGEIFLCLIIIYMLIHGPMSRLFPFVISLPLGCLCGSVHTIILFRKNVA